MCTNIIATGKRKTPHFIKGLLFNHFLPAKKNASKPSGSGIHQKSLSSDKWLEFFPTKYMATAAAMHNTPRMVKRLFLFITVGFS
jgi:hypothetical protein